MFHQKRNWLSATPKAAMGVRGALKSRWKRSLPTFPNCSSTSRGVGTVSRSSPWRSMSWKLSTDDAVSVTCQVCARNVSVT